MIDTSPRNDLARRRSSHQMTYLHDGVGGVQAFRCKNEEGISILTIVLANITC